MFQSKLFKHFFTRLIFIGLLNAAGFVLHLHQYLSWFDMVLHFLAGICVAWAGLLLFLHSSQARGRIIFFGVVLALVIGLLWEYYEWYFGITSFADGAKYISDTISDLVLDTLGGFLGSLYAMRNAK